jgi:hypothetical protein
VKEVFAITALCSSSVFISSFQIGEKSAFNLAFLRKEMHKTKCFVTTFALHILGMVSSTGTAFESSSVESDLKRTSLAV